LRPDVVARAPYFIRNRAGSAAASTTVVGVRQFKLSAIAATAVPKKHAIPMAMIQSGLRKSLSTGVVTETSELAGGRSAGGRFIVLLFRMDRQAQSLSV
jgi:hypothetical protein